MLTLTLITNKRSKIHDYRSKNVYSLLSLNLSSLIALQYGCFAQNIPLVELIAYMNDACASFNKTTPLISKCFFYQKCIELLMIKVYKDLNGLSPNIVRDIFKLKENTYNLRNFHIFESQNPRTKKFGSDNIACRDSHLWRNVSEELEIQPHFLLCSRRK